MISVGNTICIVAVWFAFLPCLGIMSELDWLRNWLAYESTRKPVPQAAEAFIIKI